MKHTKRLHSLKSLFRFAKRVLRIVIMDEQSNCPDLLSDLPLCIIHIILSFVPIRDAIRTAILSRKWRYVWSTLPHLAFDDECVNPLDEKRLIHFISQTLFLHEGPIHTFELRLPHISFGEGHCIDQWLLFLSRTDIRNLLLETDEIDYDVDDDSGIEIHSSLYSCQNFTSLNLRVYKIPPPPPSFKGFFCLKSLYICIREVSPCTIESILALSPLLEKFTVDCYVLPKWTISAPNLKYLHLESRSDHISLCTPLLEEFVGVFRLSQSFNIEGESLVFHHLRTIKLSQMNLGRKEMAMGVIRLINGSPNLQNLKISSWTYPYGEASERAFASLWDTHCTHDSLKVIKISGFTEMKLLKVLLARSPVLEKMIYKPPPYHFELLKLMAQLLRYRRASTNAEIVILNDRVSSSL